MDRKALHWLPKAVSSNGLSAAACCVSLGSIMQAVVFPREKSKFSSDQLIGEPLSGCIGNIETHLEMFLTGLVIEFHAICNLLHFLLIIVLSDLSSLV